MTLRRRFSRIWTVTKYSFVKWVQKSYLGQAKDEYETSDYRDIVWLLGSLPFRNKLQLNLNKNNDFREDVSSYSLENEKSILSLSSNP